MTKRINNITLGDIWNVLKDWYTEICFIFTTAVIFGWILAWIFQTINA